MTVSMDVVIVAVDPFPSLTTVHTLCSLLPVLRIVSVIHIAKHRRRANMAYIQSDSAVGSTGAKTDVYDCLIITAPSLIEE